MHVIIAIRVGRVLKPSQGCEVKRMFERLLQLHLPSACKWKTTTEAAVDGWKGLLSVSSSLAAENA